MSVRVGIPCLLLLAATFSFSQTSPAAFDGVEKWQNSLSVTSIGSLKTFYSITPPAMFMPKGQRPQPGISPEIDFWQNLVSSGMTDFEAKTVEETDKQGLHLVTLAVSMTTQTAATQT